MKKIIRYFTLRKRIKELINFELDMQIFYVKEKYKQNNRERYNFILDQTDKHRDIVRMLQNLL